jgi:hypothetical protein
LTFHPLPVEAQRYGRVADAQVVNGQCRQPFRKMRIHQQQVATRERLQAEDRSCETW